MKNSNNKKKVLYGIQGTGNGHLSRAREIIPVLKKYADVDVILSGREHHLNVEFDITYQKKGLGFFLGKNGGIDFPKTITHLEFAEFLKDVHSLPASDYDLIISDLEPVSAWSAYLKKVPVVLLSHHAILYSPNIPRPEGLHYGKAVYKAYMPPMEKLGYHFKAYDDFITTPIIRKDIRAQEISEEDFYLVYLDSYGTDFIEEWAAKFPEENFKVFTSNPIETKVPNLSFNKSDAIKFTKALAACKGLITGAGFETPAEALFLGKNLMVIPLQGQYEQLCNAKALEEMNVPVVWKREDFFKTFEYFKTLPKRERILYPDETEELLVKLLKKHDII